MPKDRGIFRLKKSFKYAFQGLKATYKTEQTVWIYIPVALFVIISGFIFQINRYEWIAVVLVLGIIFCLELINTALESIVDLVTEEYRVLAKKAKDTMSASVFIFAITAIVVGSIIFLPKMLELL